MIGEALARSVVLLTAGLAWRLAPAPATVAVAAMGLRFPSPLGLAAGIDRDGALAGRLGGSGFGFAEVGTVFGAAAARRVAARLARARPEAVPIAVSVASPRPRLDTQAIDEIAAMVAALASRAEAVVVNATSPRSAATRAAPAELATLLRECVAAAGRRPVAVKLLVADDMPPAGLDAAGRCGLAGVVAALPEGMGREDARRCLDRLAKHLWSGAALLTVGGVRDAADLRSRLDGGAALVQVCTAVLRGGPLAGRRLLAGLG